MKYQSTPRFDTDFSRLAPEHRRTFLAVVPAFNAAAEGHAQASGSHRWPAALRVRPMKSAPGIWEMTWSFSSPDGRATFEFVFVDGEPSIRWRRIGDHGIYARP